MKPEYLLQAIALAKTNIETTDGGPFGAVIVRAGEVIGRGANRVMPGCDPTAHAEVVAIRDACQNIRSVSLAGCEMYTSCEPCPLCLAASYWARLDKVYYAANSEDAAHAGFDDGNFYRELAKPMNERMLPMEQGCQAEARKVFEQWLQKESRIPY